MRLFILSIVRCFYLIYYGVPMKKLILILSILIILGVGWVAYGRCTASESVVPVKTEQRLREKAQAAKAYCSKNGYNTNYCFLVDFSLHSGKRRFFVWDMKGDSIKYASLCAHGYGKNSTVSKPVFSNVEGSYCSSLGKYKVGIRSYSKWGINVHYKLHGLEATNDNAFKRIVVLHSYTPLPETEVYPMHIPLGISQGCPVISDNVMRKVDALLKAEKKPVLLWVYD